MSDTHAGWMIAGVSLLVVLAVAFLLLVPRKAAPPQIDVSALPQLHAVLNGASAIFLTVGYRLIRGRRVSHHRFCMLAAFGCSALFLVSYVIYHTIVGSVQFSGPNWLRKIYFTILTSHILLASLVLPLALTTLYRAWRGMFISHRRIARWTLPIWLYVSVSGVLVYLILYHIS